MSLVLRGAVWQFLKVVPLPLCGPERTDPLCASGRRIEPSLDALSQTWKPPPQTCEHVPRAFTISLRDGETLVLRDQSRTDTVVALTDTTKIRTERKGLFRGRKPFDVTVLVPGLIVEVNGKGAGGRLVAAEVEFSEADLKAAITAYAQTAPVRQQARKRAKNSQKLKGSLPRRISSFHRPARKWWTPTSASMNSINMNS